MIVMEAQLAFAYARATVARIAVVPAGVTAGEYMYGLTQQGQ